MEFTATNEIFASQFHFIMCRFNWRGGGCLVYFRRDFSIFALRHLMVDILLATLWLPFHLINSLVQRERFYRPPWSKPLSSHISSRGLVKMHSKAEGRNLQRSTLMHLKLDATRAPFRSGGTWFVKPTLSDECNVSVTSMGEAVS